MKKIVFVFLILVLGIAPMVFSSGRSGTSAASGPITYYCSTDLESFNSAAVNTFNNKQNEVKVELVTIPNSDVETKIKTLLAGGGSEIDVFDINGVALANSYGINGATQDLRNYLNKTPLNLDNYGGKIRFATLENGIVAAMPRSWGGWFLYYNKALFDAKGIPYPKQISWDDYAKLAMEFTEKRGNTQIWGGYYPSWTLNLWALQKGVYLTDNSVDATKEAIQFLNRIYNVDKSHMNVAEMAATSSDPIAMFTSGNVAMMINGAWSLAQIKSYEDRGASRITGIWDMTNLPTPPGVPAKTGVGGISFVAINANSKQKDNSWKFLEWYLGPEGAMIYSQNGHVPSYVIPEAAQNYVNFTKYEAGKLLFDSELRIMAEQGQHPRYADILRVFRQNAELFLLGEIDIDTFGRNFVADRTPLLR